MGDQMNDQLPQDPAGLSDLMAGLTFGADAPPPPRPNDEATPVMVVRSERWPLELDERLRAAAKARGISRSQLLREWVELQLAELEQDQPISRADLLRAIAGLRPIEPSAHPETAA